MADLWGYGVPGPGERTAMANFSDYADAPRDERGRILLHRGVGVDFPHMTFHPEPDPTGTTYNDFHFTPPADWGEAVNNIRLENGGGENYGNWWGSHDEARFYAGDQHGAMTVSAWWHPHDLEGTGSGRDGLWARRGAQGEIAQAHVYHRDHGWVPLSKSQGSKVTAHRTAMPTYYHRSPTHLQEQRPDRAMPHTYFYTADDPHDVDWETRAYGDQVYAADLPAEVMEPDPAPRRAQDSPVRWWRTDPANVGEMVHLYDPTAPFGVPHRTAMPAQDAYDDFIPHFLRKRETPPAQGEFFHGSDQEYRPGDILESARARGDQARIDYMENQIGSPGQADWVWMHKHPDHVRNYGKNVYQVEPLDEGPWPWGGPRVDSWDGRLLRDDEPDDPDQEPKRYVSPRARVIRKLNTAHRTAMPRHLATQIHRGMGVPKSFFQDKSGEEIINYLHQVGGLGRSWATEHRNALGIAINKRGGLPDDPHVPVVLSAEWDGAEPDYRGPWGGGEELALKPGTQLRVTSFQVQHEPAGAWKEMLSRPVPGITASRIAMPWYHNTDAELNPGDMLLPAAERGHKSQWEHVIDYDPNSVYFTKEDDDDWAEIDRGRNRYEVEPIGEIQQDPEHFRHVRDFEKEIGRPWDAEIDSEEDVMQNSYKAPRARVVRKLPVRSDQYDHPEHPDYERLNKPVQLPTDHPAVQRIPIPFTASRTTTRKARTMTAAVTVYTQPNCVQCTMTKKQLDKLGIEHDTVDVTADPDAHAYVTGLGYTAAPVVVVNDGEDHWAGFRPDRLKGLAG